MSRKFHNFERNFERIVKFVDSKVIGNFLLINRKKTPFFLSFRRPPCSKGSEEGSKAKNQIRET